MYNSQYLTKIHKQMDEYLATINVLLIKVKNLHYNIEGFEFFEIHELLDSYYETISAESDEVAERLRMLNTYPSASMKKYIQISKVDCIESMGYSYKNVANILIADFTKVIELSHNIVKSTDEAHDIGTADLFTRHIQFYEKACWMLKSFIMEKK